VSLKTLKLHFWMVTAAAIVCVLITTRLGFWQFSRATEKSELQGAIQQQTILPPLDAMAFIASSDSTASLHRSVKLRGTWLSEHTVYLDNRQMDGKPGFFVLTPFEFEDKNLGLKKTILVQRGWVARNFIDRQQLPDIKTPAGDIALFGRIAPPPSQLYAFSGAESGAIRQNVTISELAQTLKIELMPITLLQLDDVIPQVSDGLLRRWLQPSLGIEKHYGYMFQWWALSALIASLYVWFQLIRPRMRAPQQNNND
jgi:surfeit locus 1 family protein